MIFNVESAVHQREIGYNRKRTEKIRFRLSTSTGHRYRFKEWYFAIELALKSLELGSSDREVNYAASFLVDNARLWLISSLGAETFPDWPSLRDALAKVYGPNFQVPELDEHSRALLLTNGLYGDVREQVLRDHPKTVAAVVDEGSYFCTLVP